MTKESLKNLIKECVKEVLNESLNAPTSELQERAEYEIPCPECGESRTHIDNPSHPTIYSCISCGHRWNPDNQKQNKGWSVVAVGYPGMGRGSSPKWAVHKDNDTKYLTKDGKWDKSMYAATFLSAEDAEKFAKEKLGGVKEMTTTGAVQGYMTPKAFKKTKNLKEVDWHDEESYKRSQGDEPDNTDYSKQSEVESSLINGKSNQSAANAVNKILSVLSKGLFSDNNWKQINYIFSKLREAGLEVNLLSANYGGQSEPSNGMPTYKEWKISIPFTNNKGRAVDLVGQITAHGAGTVQDPLSRYDITASVTPIVRKNVSEMIADQEQPEEYDAETDTFAPGPRSRPEDWKSGGDKEIDI